MTDMMQEDGVEVGLVCAIRDGRRGPHNEEIGSVVVRAGSVLEEARVEQYQGRGADARLVATGTMTPCSKHGALTVSHQQIIDAMNDQLARGIGRPLVGMTNRITQLKFRGLRFRFKEPPPPT